MISSQRLWTVLVPGLTPHKAKESEGSLGRSHSERDSGEEKAVVERDRGRPGLRMTETLRKELGSLGGEKRKKERRDRVAVAKKKRKKEGSD